MQKEQENKYKERVNNYIRSQIPALKELSFGCEVEERPEPTIKTEEDLMKPPKTDGFRRGKITREQHPSYKESWVVEFGDGVGIFWKQELKIIGHPIHLHHYLAVLRKAEFLNDGSGRFHWSAFSLDLGGILINNNTANRVMQFSLTDGQPATEEDWELLAKILGV